MNKKFPNKSLFLKVNCWAKNLPSVAFSKLRRYEVPNMRIIYLAILLLFSANCFSTSNRVPPKLKAGTYPEYIDKSHYDIAGVSVENSKFPKLIKELGPSEMSKGDHIEKQVCYRNNTQVIEFYISTVGFGYNVYNNNPELKNCGVTARSLVSKFGLELGLKESLVREMLGLHSETRGDKVWYNYWVQEKPSKEIQDRMRKAHGLSAGSEIWFDVYSSISVEFKRNILTHFGVHTTETF